MSHKKFSYLLPVARTKMIFCCNMVKIACAMLLMIASTSVMATNISIDSLKKLGREKLIELAAKKIDQADFKPEEYDRIVVKANSSSLIIEFGLSVLVQKKRSCFFDVVWVALAGNGDGMSIEGDCKEPVFYHRSASDQRKISFVFNAINKSNEIGHVDNHLPEGTRMKISKHLFYYEVETSDWSTFSSFKVNKVTGRISNARHKHYSQSNEEKADDFEIIN
jgi:hypothetical protein